MERLVCHSTYDPVSLLPVGLAPCTHHKRVVVRDDDEEIDAFGFDLVKVLDEAWQMANGAAWGKGTCGDESHGSLVSVRDVQEEGWRKHDICN